MAADPARNPSGIMVFIPSNGDSMIKEGQQIPGTLKFSVQYGNQHLTDAAQESPQKRSLAKCMKTEGKTLGAIQIIIGLVHVGFGSLAVALAGVNIPFSISTNYPITAGFLFIASGSVSVAAAKRKNVCLDRCSVGMNIASAMTSLSGIILYAIGIGLTHYRYRMAYQMVSEVRIDIGLSVLFLLFSSMEFIITVMVTEFGCRENCCKEDPTITYVPCTMTDNATSTKDSHVRFVENETSQ